MGKDLINKPGHYHSKGIDVIGFAEKQFDKEQLIGFHRINAIKYLTRFDKKGQRLEDLQKAAFYTNKLIELEGEDEVQMKMTPLESITIGKGFLPEDIWPHIEKSSAGSVSEEKFDMKVTPQPEKFNGSGEDWAGPTGTPIEAAGEPAGEPESQLLKKWLDIVEKAHRNIDRHSIAIVDNINKVVERDGNEAGILAEAFWEIEDRLNYGSVETLGAEEENVKRILTESKFVDLSLSVRTWPKEKFKRKEVLKLISEAHRIGKGEF